MSLRARRLLLVGFWLALCLVGRERVERLPVLCPVRRLSGRPCPGCGLTRALASLARGDFEGAWRSNWLVFIVGPALIWQLAGPDAGR